MVIKPMIMSSVQLRKKPAGADPLMLEFFEKEMGSLYASEKFLTHILTEFTGLASSPLLVKAFHLFAEESRRHMERLEKIFGLMRVAPASKISDSLAGILKSRHELISESAPGSLNRDLALVLIYQKIADYKISTCSGLSQISKVLGRGDIAQILELSLEEERNSLEWLSSLAGESLFITAGHKNQQESILRNG